MPDDDSLDLTLWFMKQRPILRPGEPCKHPGCLSHISHPCEGCGRIGGRPIGEENVSTIEK
jgi:hypothetical protein